MMAGQPDMAGSVDRVILPPSDEPHAAQAARELPVLLAELHESLKQLLELAGEKLAAMRRADHEALQRCAQRESEVLQELFRREPQRKAVFARLAQGLRASAAEAPSLSDIAARLPEPLASSLRARGGALRAVAEELQRKNRLAAAVARSLQSHIRGIFAELAGVAQESQMYGPHGQQQNGAARCWIDALG